jgi:hypothetical protein
MKRGNGMETDVKDLYDRCFLVLTRETELVGKIAAVQEEIWKGVLERTWEGMESRLETINVFEAEFRELEAEREAVLSLFPGSGDEKSRFYAFAAGFPAESRNRLTEIYRVLKNKCLRVRVSGDTLAGFLTEARSLVSGYLETVFPERRGRIYSSRGMQVEPSPRSLVLNQHF